MGKHVEPALKCGSEMARQTTCRRSDECVESRLSEDSQHRVREMDGRCVSCMRLQMVSSQCRAPRARQATVKGLLRED